jgi:hypothetical protein
LRFRRSRLPRLCACLALAAGGLLTYEAVTQVAGAVPPPAITTDYAAYPVAGSIPPSCTTDGAGVVQGLRFYLVPGAGTPARPAQWTADPGPAGDYATLRSSRRFQTFPNPSVFAGDTVVALWDGWTPGCEEVGISLSVKKSNAAAFDIAGDQALVREPNGPLQYQWCQSGTDPCNGTGVNSLQIVIPPANVTCNFQLDLAVGAPLETVGPHGSYYSASVRQQAAAAGLGTFNTTGPNMLLQPRIIVDKQWVGTANVPPVNVPDGFQLTVTSVVSAADPTVLGTATCTVTGGAFTCDYRDAAAPAVPQGGLLVNASSLLTVTETAFPGNTVDITFPVGVSSRFVNCPAAGGPCLFTITNTPPPPPTTTTTTTPTTAPSSSTTSPLIAPPTQEPTSIFPPTTATPGTLPATGSSDARPMMLLALVLVPMGAGLVLITRRRGMS